MPGGEQGIDLGPGSSGGEGFGDIIYDEDYSLGGNDNFCKDGRCIFGDGIRVFFTADVIPGANGGEGFTFFLIAGGSLLVPVNTRNSVGGDFQLPELLAYGGSSWTSGGRYLDGSGKGLKPPKMAIEFDTRTDFNSPLDYCTANNLNLIPGSRNDPKPGGTDKDVLQYVFWGSNDPNALPPDPAPLWPYFTTDNDVSSRPVLSQDGSVLYTVTDTGNVYAINPDGSDKWVFAPAGLGDVQSTPDVGGDGVVYVGDNNGDLYALATVAVPRNYRNSYASGQRGNLTSADLDATVEVDDTDNWLAGKPLTKGPWAIRMEIYRALSVNGNGKYEYTLRTWVRQCAQFDCSDITSTLFADTAGDYDHTPPAPNLPFEQVIELSQAEHDDFNRFLFGFTTAAAASDDQTFEIRDFYLDFRLTGDTPLGLDTDW
jgi:hypothetical protein